MALSTKGRTASHGDKIQLITDVKNIPDGKPITFDIYYRTKEGSSKKIDSIIGYVQSGSAVADWTVDQSNIEADEFSMYSVASYNGISGSELVIDHEPTKTICHFIDIPDIHFNFDSSIPYLDDSGNLLDALIDIFTNSEINPSKEIVIFGHTDSKGSTEYNFELSTRRCSAIKSLLDGNKETWVKLSSNSSETDVRSFLATLAARYAFHCHPDSFSTLEEAVKAFQEVYNSRAKSKIDVDGIFGPETYGAIFDIIRSMLITFYSLSSDGSSLPKLTYAYEGKGVYPCGEAFPLDGIPSTDPKNRRVEVVFFEKGECTKLLESPDKNTPISKKENPVYDSKKTEKNQITVVSSLPICLQLTHDGEILRNEPFKLFLEEKEIQTGQTDENGGVQSFIKTNKRPVVFRVETKETDFEIEVIKKG
jgi:outer membrane protein OmpA-like peptidoglycan-associated protein